MLVCRLVLWSIAAGAWERLDRSWVPLLARAVSSLAAGDLPKPLEPQVGSLVAVALSVLRAQTSPLERDEATLAYEQAVRQAGHLVLACETPFVEEYTALLSRSFAAATAPAAVAALVEDILAADPIADAMWALVAAGRDVHRHGDRMLHAPATAGNPVLSALSVVAAAQDAATEGGPVGAWAGRADSAKWALCLWQPRELFTVELGTGHLLWRHYQCSSLVSPRTLAAARSLDAAAPVPHGPYIRPIPEAVTLLAILGYARPEPPTVCT
jgi:hypothetical protein